MDKFVCPICKKEMCKISPAHANTHGMTMREMIIEYNIFGDVSLRNAMNPNQSYKPIERRKK